MADAITKREQDYSQWYIDVVRAAKLADYSQVRGCMIIRQNGMALWENMQRVLDGMFKDTGGICYGCKGKGFMSYRDLLDNHAYWTDPRRKAGESVQVQRDTIDESMPEDVPPVLDLGVEVGEF